MVWSEAVGDSGLRSGCDSSRPYRLWLWGFLLIVLGEAAGLMLPSASLNVTPRIEFAFSGARSPAWPRSPFPTGRVRAGAVAPGWVPPAGCWDLAGGSGLRQPHGGALSAGEVPCYMQGRWEDLCRALCFQICCQSSLFRRFDGDFQGAYLQHQEGFPRRVNVIKKSTQCKNCLLKSRLHLGGIYICISKQLLFEFSGFCGFVSAQCCDGCFKKRINFN